jgi:hypothetical protein
MPMTKIGVLISSRENDEKLGIMEFDPTEQRLISKWPAMQLRNYLRKVPESQKF